MEEINHVLSKFTSPGHNFLLGFTYGKHWVQSVSAYFITQQDDGPKYVLSESGTDCLCTAVYSHDFTIPEFFPVRMERGFTVLSNGAQTDSIKAALSQGKSTFDALHFPYRPAHPFSSPHISGILDRYGGYLLSVSRTSTNGVPVASHTFYEYRCTQTSYLLSTSQECRPVPFYIKVPTGKLLADQIWESLNPDTRAALFVRYIDRRNGFPETVIINRYGASSYSAPKTAIWPTRRNRK